MPSNITTLPPALVSRDLSRFSAEINELAARAYTAKDLGRSERAAVARQINADSETLLTQLADLQGRSGPMGGTVLDVVGRVVELQRRLGFFITAA